MRGCILSLCDRSGVWSAPYRDAGYEVVQVDLADGQDVRLFEAPRRPVRGVLAAPPCTVFAQSGARWTRSADELLTALSIVDACLRIVAITQPAWWALENPPGKLRRWLGSPRFSFDPCDFAGWADDPDAEAYTKTTYLWGAFIQPETREVPPNGSQPIYHAPASSMRRDRRSLTQSGFARAFFAANP